MTEKQAPKRVAVFIDGYNLFNALKQLFGKKYYRTNYKKLSKQYLGPEDKLAQVYYFTALYHKDPVGTEYHKNFIEALHTFGVRTVKGKYQNRDVKFNKSYNKVVSATYGTMTANRQMQIITLPLPDRMKFKKYEEKRTDVNMASYIIADGFNDKYDKAIIITGDSDIAPAIEMVKKFFPEKEFLAVIPIGRPGTTIKQTCGQDVEMLEQHLIDSQLPEIVTSGNQTFQRPPTWQ